MLDHKDIMRDAAMVPAFDLRKCGGPLHLGKLTCDELAKMLKLE
jgi:hypothetical protein